MQLSSLEPPSSSQQRVSSSQQRVLPLLLSAILLATEGPQEKASNAILPQLPRSFAGLVSSRVSYGICLF
jgi:hypothetical protein